MGISILKGYQQVQTTLGEPATPSAPSPAPAASSKNAFALKLSAKPLISPDEVALRYPQGWLQSVYQRQMDRKAGAKDLQWAEKQYAGVLKRHGSLEQAKNAVLDGLKKTQEYKLRHPKDWLAPIYKNALKRGVNGKDVKWAEGQIAPILRKDGTVKQAEAKVAAAIKQTAEYKRAHPPISKNRDAIYRTQPNGWTCGPTSLTMALAALGMRNTSDTTLNEMIRRTGANSNDGVPGNASLIANAARQVGAQASFSADGSPAAVRAALKRGHGVVLNGSLGIGGHFIYVAGLDKDGRFIICDPARSGITRMSNSELDQFANTYGNPRGFAEIWR